MLGTSSTTVKVFSSKIFAAWPERLGFSHKRFRSAEIGTSRSWNNVPDMDKVPFLYLGFSNGIRQYHFLLFSGNSEWTWIIIVIKCILQYHFSVQSSFTHSLRSLVLFSLQWDLSTLTLLSLRYIPIPLYHSFQFHSSYFPFLHPVPSFAPLLFILPTRVLSFFLSALSVKSQTTRYESSLNIFLLLPNKMTVGIIPLDVETQLFCGGRTTHFSFKIPIPCHRCGACNIPAESQMVPYHSRAESIVWEKSFKCLCYGMKTVNWQCET